MPQKRDNFNDKVRRALQERAGNRCSNPLCRCLTSGPNLNQEKATRIGVASHITAAALGGPRHDATLTIKARRSIKNGIWLCQNCAHLIDADWRRYSVETLRNWREQAEQRALIEIRGSPPNHRRLLALLSTSLALLSIAWIALSQKQPLGPSDIELDATTRTNPPTCPSWLDNPFQNKKSTHILISDFDEPNPPGAHLSQAVADQILRALQTFRDEDLQNPKTLDIYFPANSLEIGRIPCAIRSHEEAESIAQRLDAHIVIWGEVFTNLNSSYSILPRATFRGLRQTFRVSNSREIELTGLGNIDLPALKETDPFSLVQLAIGLHFLEQEMPWLAARFLEKSAQQILARDRNAAALEDVLAITYINLADFEKALQYGQKALSRVRGSGTIQEARLLNTVGLALDLRGRPLQAIAYHEEALAIARKALDNEDPELFRFLDILGSSLNSQGLFSSAEAIIEEGATRSIRVGSRVYDAAVFMNNLGVTLHQQGKLLDAYQQHRQALILISATMGTHHPVAASISSNMCDILQELDLMQYALASCRFALEISEETVGPEHPETILRVSKVALALQRLGNNAEALTYSERVLAISLKPSTSLHPAMLLAVGNLGMLSALQGDRQKAKSYLYRAVRELENSRGKEHPDLIAPLTGLCLLLTKEWPTEGSSFCSRALQTAEKIFGQDHPRVWNVRLSVSAAMAASNGWSNVQSKRGVVFVGEKYGRCPSLAIGDWIIKLGDTPVDNPLHLMKLMALNRPRAPMEFSVRRGGKTLAVPECNAGVAVVVQ